MKKFIIFLGIISLIAVSSVIGHYFWLPKIKTKISTLLENKLEENIPCDIRFGELSGNIISGIKLKNVEMWELTGTPITNPQDTVYSRMVTKSPNHQLPIGTEAQRHKGTKAQSSSVVDSLSSINSKPSTINHQPSTIIGSRQSAIRNPQSSNLPVSQPMFTISELTIKPNIIGLITKSNTPISSIVLNMPKLNIQRNTNGQINIIELFKKMPKTKKQTSFPFKRLIIEQGQIVLIDSYKYGKPIKENFAVTTALVLFRNNELVIRKTLVKYGDTALNIKGTIKTAKSPVFMDIKTNITPLHLKDIFKLTGTLILHNQNFSIPVNLYGNSVLHISGQINNWNLDGNTTFDKGTIGTKEIEYFKIIFSPKNANTIKVEDLSLKFKKGGTLLGTIDIQPKTPFPFHIKTSMDNIPIDTILDMIPYTKGFLSGNLNAKAKLSGKLKNYERISGTAVAKIVDGEIKQPSNTRIEPLKFNSIEGNCVINQSAFTLKTGSLISNDLNIHIGGKIGFDKQLNLAGIAEVRKGRVAKGVLKKLIAPALPDTEKGYKFKFKIKGTLDNPKIEHNIVKTLINGFEDNVKDVGNKIEKFFKKIF